MNEEHLHMLQTKELFNCTEQEAKALNLIFQYGGIDGAHHKDWVLDQVVRILTGDRYHDFVKFSKTGEMGNCDGEEDYSYDEGVAP